MTSFFFFFSSRRRHTRFSRDWSSDVCSSDLETQRELAGRGYRAIAADLRGHGDSDWAPDRDYSPAAIAHDVLRLIAWTGRKPALVGVTPRVNIEGARRVFSFMRSHPDGFEDLEEAADAVAAYLPHRPRPRA